MGFLLMNIAQISMYLMKAQDTAFEVLKIIARFAIIQFQIITIIFIHNGKILDLIRELVQNFMVG